MTIDWNEDKWKVLNTKRYPKKYKVYNPKRSYNNNIHTEYFATFEEATEEARKRNQKDGITPS